MKTWSRQLSFITLLFITPLAYSADYYVQSIKAPLLSAPSFGSARIGEAVKGEVLKELERKGGWHKVSYKDKTGWVSRLLIGPRPPAARVSVLEGTSENLETGARRRASAFTTAAAARGFSEDRSRVSDQYKVNFKGVERMETLRVNDDEAMTFLLEGVGK